MKINRREFLRKTRQSLSMALLATHFPDLSWGSLFSASPGNGDHFFVLFRTSGGMDVTLGLDPQIMPAGADASDLFLEYRPEDIVQAASLSLGPSARPLAPFAESCAVINGIMMRRDAGHEPCNLYMATGRGDGKAASLPVELALSMAPGSFGVVMNESTYTAGKSIILSGTDEILNDTESGNLRELVKEKLKVSESTGSPLEDAERALVGSGPTAERVADLMKQLKQKEGTLQAKHALAAVFAAGGARQAQLNINVSGNLDTHANHEKVHLKLQTDIWTEIASVFKLFQSIPYGDKTLFDATTFMVISEFSRTPQLNAAKGKDHNPFTNSVLLAGKGVRGGRTWGASRLIPRKKSKTGSADHIAAPYDYENNKVAEHREGASFIFPENVIQTVGKIFGSPPGFAPVAESVLAIPDLAI